MLCRHRHRLQEDATTIKLRLLAWLGLTSPGLVGIVGSDLSAADRESIQRYPVVGRVLQVGRSRLEQFLESEHHEWLRLMLEAEWFA